MVHGGGSGGGGGGDWWHLTRISSISAPLSLSRKPLFHITTDNGVMGLDLKTKSYNSRFHNYHFDSGGLYRTLPQLPLRFWWAWSIQLGFDFGTDDRFGLDFRQNNSQFGFGQQLWIWVWVTGSDQ